MKRILIVDDSDLILLLYKGIFSNHPNIKVDTEADSRKVTERLKKNSYDLLIIDLIMPGMDGYQLLKKIMKYPGIEHIPIFISSGLHERDINEEVQQLGVQGFIKKPIDNAEIRRKIEDELLD